MKRMEIAPGAFLTVVPGEKFKRSKIAINLVVPGKRETATGLALLPHVLDRRCEAVPDAMQLARKLFDLYGAELSSESYTAGANRVVGLGISGLKNEFAMAGENLAGEYLDLVSGLLFAPLLRDGVFLKEDTAIEREKQADFLRSEMNDKRGYCLRQARRKLYGTSPLGLESAGYLEDIDEVTQENLYWEYGNLLHDAQVEVMVCGMDEALVAKELAACLEEIGRRLPVKPATAAPLAKPEAFRQYSEAMDTVQGKLCIMLTSASPTTAQNDAVMRLASAIYGGLPTSRLFMNVREKQSLCYYCSSSFGYFGSTLTVDSGVDHENAQRAADAILKELDALKEKPVDEEELETAKRYMRSIFSTAKDSPDALMNFAFNEWLRGTNRSLDETLAQVDAVTATQVCDALQAYQPAVQYVLTGKAGAESAQEGGRA